MQSLWVVFLTDYMKGTTKTIGEFHAVSSECAKEDAMYLHGHRDWWEYFTVPSEWFKSECLDMLLEGAIH